MLCTKCGKRPAASAEGRCVRCAALYRTPSNGLMAAMPMTTSEAWNRLRSPVGLSKAVSVLLSVGILVDLLSIATGLNLRSALADEDSQTLPVYSSESVNANTLYSNVSGLQMLALLATAVVFIVWFRRVRLNAEVFDASQQPMKPGWAIGAWFVPIAQFWLPRRVAKGVWAASARFDADGNWRTESTAPLDRWWAAWVLSAIFGRVASEVYQRAGDVEGIRDATALYMAADLVNILAAVLAIVFVRQLTRMQGERAALGSHPHAAQATPTPLA